MEMNDFRNLKVMHWDNFVSFVKQMERADKFVKKMFAQIVTYKRWERAAYVTFLPRWLAAWWLYVT